MRSHILGKVDLDQERLAADLAYLDSAPTPDEEYDEFCNGFWKNVSLWNATGSSDDMLYRDVESAAIATEHAENVPYLSEIVTSVFDVRRIQMARTRNLRNGVILPHRDFVELDREPDNYLRVFMFLQPSPEAFHSNEDAVIHMRPGEIWFLDAATVHSAVNLTESGRQSLCVDFAFDGPFDTKEIFADPATHDPGIEPRLVRRRPFTAEHRDRILALGDLVERDTFRDLAFLLSKIHFRYDVHPAETYTWLAEISRRAGDDAMVDKAEQLRTFAIDARPLSGRFSLTAW